MKEEKAKKAMKQSTMGYFLCGFSILLVLAVFLLFADSANVNNAVATFTNDKFELIDSANLFAEGSRYLSSEIRAYAGSGDKIHYDNYMNELNTLKRREVAKNNLDAIGLAQNEENLFKQMGEVSDSLVPIEMEAMDCVQEGDLDGALSLVFGDKYEDGLNKISASQEGLFASISERTGVQIKALEDRSRRVYIICYAVFAFLIAFQILNLVLISRKILRPVKGTRNAMMEVADGLLHGEFSMREDSSEIGQLVHSIKQSKIQLSTYIGIIDSVLAQMADGDFDIDIDMDFIGDFGEIKNSIISFSDTMCSTIDHVTLASSQVALGAEQISNCAQTLAKGTAEQSATLQQISSSLHVVDEQIHTSSQHTANAADRIHGTVTSIRECDKQMSTLRSSMAEIDGMTAEINNIVKTIDDIAFQTNILALNAAVEAARAGTAGKGFAVVAEEVRSLAGKSALAAKDTETLIENTVRAVRNSNSMANDTSEKLHEVVGDSGEIIALIDEISETSKLQEKELDEISIGVDQIATVLTDNAATSEESASTSQELAAMSETLTSIMNEFNTQSHHTSLAQENPIPQF